MSVLLTVRLPASEFDMGRVIEAVDGVHVEVETVVPRAVMRLGHEYILISRDCPSP